MSSSRSRQPISSSRSRYRNWFKARKRVLLGAFDLVLILTVAAVGLVALSLGIEYSRGYSKTLPGPKWTMRLQIVDGSATKAVLAKSVNEIKKCEDDDLKIDIVEKTRFDLTSLPKTFLVSREENLEPTRVLAERLGLDPDDVDYEPMENDYKHITATLILGAESDKWLAAREADQEGTTRN